MKIKTNILLATLVIQASTGTADAINLLTNPGFENGLTGWTIVSGTAGLGNASPTPDPLLGGTQYLTGSDSSLFEATQTISLSALGYSDAVIDAEGLTADFSGTITGPGASNGITGLRFIDSIGDLSFFMLNNGATDTWTTSSNDVFIPFGTRSVEFVFRSNSPENTFFDAASLSITPEPIPEPSSFLLVGLASLGLATRRQR